MRETYLIGKFGIQRADRSAITWMLIFGTFLGVFQAFYFTGVMIEFVFDLGIENLPKAFIISGLAGAIFSITFSSFQRIISFGKLSIVFMLIGLISVFLVLASHIQMYLGEEVILFAKFAIWGISNVIIYLIFKGLMTNFFDIKKEKKLAERIESGKVLATALAYFLSPLIILSGLISYQKLIPLSSIFLFCSLCILLLIVSKFKLLRVLRMNKQYLITHNNLIEIAKNNYVVLLFTFAVISVTIASLVDYSFFMVVSDRYAAPGDMVYFVGLLFGGTTIGGYIFRLFTHKRIIFNYGLKASLLVLPAAITLFFGISYGAGLYYGYTAESERFILFFIVVAVCKAVYMALDHALQTPSFSYYFFQIEKMLRMDLFARLQGAGSQIALMLGGGILMLALHYLPFEVIDNTYIIVGLCVLQAIIIFYMHIHYKVGLLLNLDKQNDKLAEFEKNRSLTYAEKIANNIMTYSSQNMSRILTILNIIDPVIYKQAILMLLKSEDEFSQGVAIQQAGELCLLEAIPVLEDFMDSKYFPASKNNTVAKLTYRKLRDAEFRLGKLKYIEQLTISKLKDERIFGALLTKYADDSTQAKLLIKLLRDPVMEVRYYAVAASAGTKNKDLQSNLIEKLSVAYYSNAATAASAATGIAMFKALEMAFYATGQEEKVQQRIVQIYGRVGTEEAISLLVKKLEYPNQNIVSEVLNAISRCHHNVTGSNIFLIRRELEEVCNVLVWNMSAYLDLKREHCSELLLRALQTEIENNKNNIFKLLALIYDPKSVDLVKENINSGDPEKSEFASELLDVFLEDQIKSTIIPLLNVSSYQEKVNKLQGYIPSEPLSKEEVLYHLIQRDYKWVNRWTKTCAIKELAERRKAKHKTIFLANVVNPDPMMSEAAISAVFQLKNTDFIHDLKRLDQKEAIKRFQRINTTESEDAIPTLKFEIIAWFSKVQLLKNIPGLILLEFAKHAEIINTPSGKQIAKYKSIREMDYYIVYQGLLGVVVNGKIIKKYKPKGFVNYWDFIDDYRSDYKVVALEDTSFYKIPREQFNETISFYEEVPIAILTSKNKNRLSTTVSKVY